MIIWINGSFGAGKTSVSHELKKEIPESILFDPEEVGGLIHRIVPHSKSTDFQDYKMWREIVINYLCGLYKEFGLPIIVPMTLIKPDYINEIFESLKNQSISLKHFYLDIDEEILRGRIKSQIIHTSDSQKDEWIRNWRLERVSQCLEAKKNMPCDTIYLDSGKNEPIILARDILRLANI